MRHVITTSLTLAIAVTSCTDDSATADLIPPAHVTEVLEQFNRGIGMMDRFQPAEGVKAFERVVELAPGWTTGRLNLGVALVNAQKPELFDRAEEQLRFVIEHAPENPYGPFTLGVLLQYLGRTDEALPMFERTVKLDPDDADANYQVGLLIANDDPTRATKLLERALELVPHHASACYRLQVLARATGNTERADELLERFNTLQDTETGFRIGNNYGEAGHYAEVIRRIGVPQPSGAADAVPNYTEAAESLGLTGEAQSEALGWPGDNLDELREIGASAFGPGVAVADVNGDGQLDVYVVDAENGGKLYRRGAARFEVQNNTGIDGQGAAGAFFGDYDADGDPDLYLTRAGPNRLYRNDGTGKFEDVTDATGTGGGDVLSLGAVWADADHDGDLDLYVANFCAWPLAEGAEVGAPNALLRNNSLGQFEDVASAAGIDGGNAASVGVLFFDIDDDRDLDAYVINHRSANRVFHNDRAGAYSKVRDNLAVFEDDGPGTGAVLADFDGNGREDLLLLRGAEQPVLLSQQQRGRYTADTAFAERTTAITGVLNAVTGDLDLDGDIDLVLVSAASGDTFGQQVMMNQGDGRFAVPVAIGPNADQPSTRGAIAADIDSDGALDLLFARTDGPLRLLRAPTPTGRHWLQVQPIETNDGGPTWPEPTAVGLTIEIKTGRKLQLRRLASSSGFLSSPPLRAHFGLGASTKCDYARFVWPDAVLQSELEIPADQIWELNKVVRRPSSCPVLFSWDGEKFAFVTDFLGVGGCGAFVEPGVYAPPDPTEDVRIPPELVHIENGKYLLRITEPLEEVTWFDQLDLRVYDHPGRFEVHCDERFAGDPPFATGQPIAIQRKIMPVAARDDRNRPMLDRITTIDRHCVEPNIDKRFKGYAHDHWLELDFGDQLRDLPADRKLVLFMQSWVDYTYSHVNFAAYQSGLTMRMPSLELPDGQGGWHAAIESIGFPAGLPRMMTFDVSKLPLRSQSRMRLRTNMQVFRDQIFLAERHDVPEMRTHVLQPEIADLRMLGITREYSPDGREPTIYDYHRIDRGVAFKNMTGNYTRFGDVRELLAEADDKFVVMGRGEEIVLEFDAASLPAMPEGWTRTLALHCDGYCKDMDLYTACPDTVGPAPFHAMENYPPKKAPPHAAELAEYEREWNTRRVVDR